VEHEPPGVAPYRVVLVPRLWLLSLTQRSRMNVGDALPIALEKALREGGLRDFSLRLQRPYKPLDHVCMYRESHLAFFSRWVEREGLYFHFEHGEDAKTPVVSDARPHAPPVGAPVRFMSSADTRGGVEAVTHLSVQRRVTAAEVTLRDYDPLNPTLDVSGHGAVDADGRGLIVPRRRGCDGLSRASTHARKHRTRPPRGAPALSLQSPASPSEGSTRPGPPSAPNPGRQPRGSPPTIRSPTSGARRPEPDIRSPGAVTPGWARWEGVGGCSPRRARPVIAGVGGCSPRRASPVIAGVGGCPAEPVTSPATRYYEPAPPAATTTAGPATGDAPSGSRSGST